MADVYKKQLVWLIEQHEANGNKAEADNLKESYKDQLQRCKDEQRIAPRWRDRHTLTGAVKACPLSVFDPSQWGIWASVSG